MNVRKANIISVFFATMVLSGLGWLVHANRQNQQGVLDSLTQAFEYRGQVQKHLSTQSLVEKLITLLVLNHSKTANIPQDQIAEMATYIEERLRDSEGEVDGLEVLADIKNKPSLDPDDFNKRLVALQNLSLMLSEKANAVQEASGDEEGRLIGSLFDRNWSFFGLYVAVLGLIVLSSSLFRRKAQVEEVVETSEVLHKYLLGHLGEAILVCTANGKVILHNRSAEKFLNLTTEEFKNTSIDQVFSVIVREDKSLCSFPESKMGPLVSKNMILKNYVFGYEIGGSSPLNWLQLNSHPLPPRHFTGKAAFIVSFSDVTERYDQQRRILDQQAQIVSSAKMAALGEMASGIAHEINNPLAVIQLDVDELYDTSKQIKSKEGETVRSIAEQIDKTTGRIADIIRGLLSFAREDDTDTLDEVDVIQVIRDTLQFCKHRLRDGGIELRYTSPEVPILVRGQGTQLSQVLLNLLVNAADAIGSLPEKWIELQILADASRVQIRVIDSGSGIQPEIAEKIFQPFFTTKDVGQGTGLGMSISKGIIENHNGEIFLDHACPNTCFVVSLPRDSGSNDSKTSFAA